MTDLATLQIRLAVVAGALEELDDDRAFDDDFVAAVAEWIDYHAVNDYGWGGVRLALEKYIGRFNDRKAFIDHLVDEFLGSTTEQAWLIRPEVLPWLQVEIDYEDTWLHLENTYGMVPFEHERHYFWQAD